MSHPYISLITGTERLRAGFGPEHCTVGGHCPINKIFGEILAHGLAKTMGKLLLLSIKTAPWEPLPCGRQVRLQSRRRLEEVSCGGFPLKSFSRLKAFPCWPLELAHREEWMAASQRDGEGHGNLPREAAVKHPKGNYCLHARLLFSLLILLLYGNICQAITFDFDVFTVAEGK